MTRKVHLKVNLWHNKFISDKKLQELRGPKAGRKSLKNPQQAEKTRRMILLQQRGC